MSKAEAIHARVSEEHYDQFREIRRIMNMNKTEAVEFMVEQMFNILTSNSTINTLIIKKASEIDFLISIIEQNKADEGKKEENLIETQKKKHKAETVRTNRQKEIEKYNQERVEKVKRILPKYPKIKEKLEKLSSNSEHKLRALMHELTTIAGKHTLGWLDFTCYLKEKEKQEEND